MTSAVAKAKPTAAAIDSINDGFARELIVDLYPAQDDFVFDERRYVAFVAGRNSGKTYSGSIKAMLKAEAVGGLGVIGAPTFPMLVDGAKRQFLDRLDQYGMVYRLQKSTQHLYIPTWNAEIMFATLDNPSRVRSPNFSWGWVDEIEYLVDTEIWRALKGAVRVGPFQLFVTSTPKGRRLVWNEWVLKRDRNHKLYRATTYDNVFINAEDYVSGLGYEGRYALQEIGAEFVGFEGLVYPAFSRDKNIAAIDTAGWRKVMGVDIGTRNPTAIMTIAAGGDRRHIESEFYQAGMSSSAILAAIEAEADRVNPETIFLDPSALSYILDLVADGYPAEKANNEVSYGIGTVTTAIVDGLTLDPSCANTVVEFESYQYPENRTETDKPKKQFDHAMDAIRYGLVGIAGDPVQMGVVSHETQEALTAWSDGE